MSEWIKQVRNYEPPEWWVCGVRAGVIDSTAADDILSDSVDIEDHRWTEWACLRIIDSGLTHAVAVKLGGNTTKDQDFIGLLQEPRLPNRVEALGKLWMSL